MNQISQSAEFNALRKPPKALSRQVSASLASFGRSEMAIRLTAAVLIADVLIATVLIATVLILTVLGFGLGRPAAVTFFGLGSCRWRLISIGGSEEPTLTTSG